MKVYHIKVIFKTSDHVLKMSSDKEPFEQGSFLFVVGRDGSYRMITIDTIKRVDIERVE